MAHRRKRDARTRRTQRMSNRNRAAVRIYARVGKVYVEHLQTPQHLCGERFINLDYIHVSQRKIGPCERLLYRKNGPQTHHSGFYACDGTGDDSHTWLHTELLTDLAITDH